MRKALKDMSREALTGFFSESGEKPFRVAQLLRRMYAPGVADFDAMTDLPLSLRARLAEETALFTLAKRDARVSRTDGTRKYVFKTADGFFIESVFMRYRFGNSVCVSSQAGCAMGCVFCASGMDGLRRDLTAGEMTDQILLSQIDTGERVSHAVVMGTGEPLVDFERLKRFAEVFSSPDGLGLSRRNLTVSTCGLIPGIRRLADELPQVGLAVSLHAPDDAIRDMLMPVNRSAGGVDALLAASREHAEKTGRRVTFEYALIDGINDDRSCAEHLSRKLRGINGHVNLIPLNRVAGSAFSGSAPPRVEDFRSRLERTGVAVTVRRETGRDLEAACGQLKMAAEAENRTARNDPTA